MRGLKKLWSKLKIRVLLRQLAVFGSPPTSTWSPAPYSMRDPPVPAKLLTDVTRATRRSIHDILCHFQNTAPGAECDQHVIQNLHFTLLLAIDGAIRQKLYNLNPRIWRLPNIPNEVWLEIWSRLPMHGRLAVTHVCRDWRQLALGSPTLWSDIEFEYCCNAYSENDLATCRLNGSPHRDHGGRTTSWTHRESLPEILRRGRGPLRFSLTISGDDWNCTEYFLVDMARALKPHAHRLVDLKVTGSYQQLDLPLLLVLAGPTFPRLGSLFASDFCQDAETNPSPTSIGVYARLGEFQAPALRSADLDIYSPWLEPLLLNSQMTNLTTAMFCPGHYNDAIGILHACPRLKSLHLTFTGLGPTNKIWPGTDGLAVGHLLEDLHVTDLPVDDFNPGAAARFLDSALRPSRQSIKVSLSTLNDTQRATRAYRRATTMFCDLFGEPRVGTDATLEVTTAEFGATVDLCRPATVHYSSKGCRRRQLTFDWMNDVSVAMSPVWRTIDAARIRTFKLNMRTSYLPPFPVMRVASRNQTGAFVLPNLELFVLVKSREASLSRLRAIDWATTVPKSCKFEVKLQEAVPLVFIFRQTDLFMLWLSAQIHPQGIPVVLQ